MNPYTKRVLTAMISKTREACAGSNIADRETVVRYIHEALDYAGRIDAGKVIIGKLNTSLEIMRNAIEFRERLPADNILCDILNTDLRD